MELLRAIPGIQQRSADGILAEIGADMSRFPSAEHLASWAETCPGNNKTAGEHKSGKTQTRRAPSSCAAPWSSAPAPTARNKDPTSSPPTPVSRGAAGHAKAIVALGHSILVVARLFAYQLLSQDALPYEAALRAYARGPSDRARNIALPRS